MKEQNSYEWVCAKIINNVSNLRRPYGHWTSMWLNSNNFCMSSVASTMNKNNESISDTTCTFGYFLYSAEISMLLRTRGVSSQCSMGPGNQPIMTSWHENVFSLALCEGNPPVTDGLLSQKGPVIRIFDICIVLSLKRILLVTVKQCMLLH